jgi:hypothetical protein
MCVVAIISAMAMAMYELFRIAACLLCIDVIVM